jgi:hypothetical protein
MANVPLDKKKDATYHVLKATDEWANFVDAMVQEATNTVGQRARVVASRKRATTYARDELGGH